MVTVVTKNLTVAAEPQRIPLEPNEKCSVIYGVNTALGLLNLRTCLRTIWILQNCLNRQTRRHQTGLRNEFKIFPPFKTHVCLSTFF